MINGSSSKTKVARPASGGRDRAEAEQIDKRLARFIARNLTSALELEVLIHLAYHPSHFYTLEDLRVLASAPSGDIEDALIALEDRGLIFFQRQRGTVRARLRRIPAVMRSSQLLWRYSRTSGGMARLLDLVRRRE